MLLYFCCKENECFPQLSRMDGDTILFIILNAFCDLPTRIPSVNPCKSPYKYPCKLFSFVVRKNEGFWGMSVASTTLKVIWHKVTAAPKKIADDNIEHSDMDDYFRFLIKKFHLVRFKLIICLATNIRIIKKVYFECFLCV